jgi:hypothetical protein
LARRTESAGLSVVRELMQQLLHDGPTPA